MNAKEQAFFYLCLFFLSHYLLLGLLNLLLTYQQLQISKKGKAMEKTEEKKVLKAFIKQK
jgi:hypothetical protein